jgi:hypothetical protein
LVAVKVTADGLAAVQRYAQLRHMDQLDDLVPLDKRDVERARAAVDAGYPAVEVWKYWVIGRSIPSLAESAAVEFRPELERLAYTPRPNERSEELDERAREVLEHFGWNRRDA